MEWNSIENLQFWATVAAVYYSVNTSQTFNLYAPPQIAFPLRAALTAFLVPELLGATFFPQVSWTKKWGLDIPWVEGGRYFTYRQRMIISAAVGSLIGLGFTGNFGQNAPGLGAAVAMIFASYEKWHLFNPTGWWRYT